MRPGGLRASGIVIVVALLAFAFGWAAARSRDRYEPTRPLPTSGDPMTAFVETLRIEDPAARAVSLAALLESTDPERAEDLHALLVEPEAGMIVDEIAESLVASWWARSDPAAAFRNAIDPPWADRHPWLRHVLREWVKRQPIMAVEAIDTLPQNPEQGRLEAARVVLDAWFDLEDVPDPTPLVRLFRHLELKPRALAMERMLNAIVGRQGLDAAESFVESLQPLAGTIGPNIEQELRARMGVVLLGHDVDRAIAWAEEHGEGREGVGIRKHLAYYWGLRDGPAAMEWAMGLPDSPERGAVVKRAWLSFGRVKPEEARAWLVERGPEPVLAGIYARHLQHVAERDPERALTLAQRTDDEAVRERMLVAVGLGWMRFQPEAAEAWLESGDLPPRLVARIRAAAARRTMDRGTAMPTSVSTEAVADRRKTEPPGGS